MTEVVRLQELCRLAADAVAAQRRAIERLREARARIEALDVLDEFYPFDPDLREPGLADGGWNERIR